ncbi:MAG: hypothetical protein ACI4A3_09170 [Lachnospiraceae bacterium]
MSNVIRICGYELRIQMKSKRVWLGYLTGIVLIINQSMEYIRYAGELGEAVNVLEPFLVAVNNPNTIIFLVLGWMLVISSTPFIDTMSFYVIHRTSRKNWNRAILVYIIIQAVLYYFILWLATVIISFQNGYLANVWSYPLIKTASGIHSSYDINFPYIELVNAENIFSVFIHSFLLAVLYAVMLGILTYVVSLAFRHNIGPVFGVAFHFLGYEIMKEGLGFAIDYSLLARSVAVLQIGKGALVNVFDTYLIFLIGIVILAELSQKIIAYIDFPKASREEAAG